MRIILLIIFACAIHDNVIAQKVIEDTMRKNSGIQSIRIGYYAGIPKTLGNYVQINFKKKYSLGIDYMYKSDYFDLPPDYKEGLCLFGNCTPKKEVHFVSAFIGKSILENNNLYVTFNLGISWVRQSKPVFIPYDAGISLIDLSSNYTASYKIKNTAGILLVAAQEWKISKTIGLNVSFRTNLNAVNSVVSLNAGASFDLFQKKFSGK